MGQLMPFFALVGLLVLVGYAVKTYGEKAIFAIGLLGAAVWYFSTH